MADLQLKSEVTQWNYHGAKYSWFNSDSIMNFAVEIVVRVAHQMKIANIITKKMAIKKNVAEASKSEFWINAS